MIELLNLIINFLIDHIYEIIMYPILSYFETIK
jgi:hypothetical protein